MVLPLALTNYGHFTSMRVDADRTIRGLTLHMERLARDCKIVYGADLDTRRVRDHVREALDGQAGPCVVRVTIYDPAVEMGHPADAENPSVLVTVRPAGKLPPTPLHAKSVQYERTPTSLYGPGAAPLRGTGRTSTLPLPTWSFSPLASDSADRGSVTAR